jgi:hypothetical protein
MFAIFPAYHCYRTEKTLGAYEIYFVIPVLLDDAECRGRIFDVDVPKYSALMAIAAVIIVYSRAKHRHRRPGKLPSAHIVTI